MPEGRFTAAFLARLLHQKYVLGLPVHQIVRAPAADGLDVAEGTVSGALKAAAGLLVPLEDAIAARHAEAVHVHADETSWRVFGQAGGKDGHRWWLWAFIAADTVVFRMDPTRSAAVLERHLGIDPRRRRRASAGGKAPAGPVMDQFPALDPGPRHRRQPGPRPARDQAARLTRAPGHQHGRASTMPSHPTPNTYHESLRQ
ncbi:MAG: IS66 family transposase [Actinomycetota bacterium]|nr:IS66 family transposase [Actinomycetota bacterium]